jgi:hypothetical protein
LVVHATGACTINGSILVNWTFSSWPATYKGMFGYGGGCRGRCFVFERIWIGLPGHGRRNLGCGKRREWRKWRLLLGQPATRRAERLDWRYGWSGHYGFHRRARREHGRHGGQPRKWIPGHVRINQRDGRID